MGKSESRGVPMELRRVIAANLATFMAAAQGGLDDETLGKAAGVSYKTIQRLRLPDSNPDHGPNLESLCRIAEALGKQVWELMVPRPRGQVVSGTARQTEAQPRNSSSFAMQTHKRKDKKTGS